MLSFSPSVYCMATHRNRTVMLSSAQVAEDAHQVLHGTPGAPGRALLTRNGAGFGSRRRYQTYLELGRAKCCAEHVGRVVIWGWRRNAAGRAAQHVAGRRSVRVV